MEGGLRDGLDCWASWLPSAVAVFRMQAFASFILISRGAHAGFQELHCSFDFYSRHSLDSLRSRLFAHSLVGFSTYICQSQSLNVHLQALMLGQLTGMHFYGWKKGLKMVMYYLRTWPAVQAIQFMVGCCRDSEIRRRKRRSCCVRWRIRRCVLKCSV
jgi:hypothetical protein